MEKLLKKKKKAELDGNKTLLVSVCIDLAELHLANNNHHTAIDEYQTVAAIYKQQNKMLDYGRAHRMIGEAYMKLLLYDKALKHEDIFLKVAQKENNKVEEQRALATIGHIYLTIALSTDETGNKNFELAANTFIKSLSLCEKLTGEISKTEQMDMMARLFANLGIVKEAQGKVTKGIELVMKSINICKKYDIFEQLERNYTSLSSFYVKIGDHSNAISNLNSAMEIAARLRDKVALTCSCLIAKGDILVKMNDLQGAKRVLHKAYKLKTNVPSDRDTIEKNLKIVMAMNYAEENLLVASLEDHKTRKKYYEQLGDGACYFKNYTTAINYYKMMLDSALKNNESGKALSPCYVSLAQTYLDNQEYDKAIEFYNLDLEVTRLAKNTQDSKESKDNLTETINTIFNITSAMDLAHKDVNDVCDIYNKAQDECKALNSTKQLARVLDRHILYLKKSFRLTDAAKLEHELDALDCCPDSDSGSEDGDGFTIGDDMDLNNITDVSSSDDEKDLTVRTTRKRNKNITITKNSRGESQLHIAALTGNYKLAEGLLAQGHVVNIRDFAGWLPIHEACNKGHLDIVKLLVEKGASLTDRGGNVCEGTTPLHDACLNGHFDIIEYLLSMGASPLTKNDQGDNPLNLLKTYRAASHLTGEEEASYNRVVEIMTTALLKAGQNYTGPSIHSVNDAFIKEDDDVTVVSLGKRTKSKNADLRRNPNVGIDDDLLLTNDTKATCDYKNAMDLFRKSSNSDVKKRKSTTPSAFLTSNEVHDDDWLDDDLNTTNKSNKKKCRVNLSLNRRNSSASTSFIGPYDLKSDKSETDCEMLSDDCASLDLENLEPNRTINSASSSSSGKNKSGFKKRKSQQTLFKSGFTRVRNSPSPVESMFNGSNWGSDKSINCRTQTKLHNFVIAGSDSSSRISESSLPTTNDDNFILNTTQSLIRNQMLFIDVRIDGKLFRIPFPAKDLETLTISWLAEETTKRFYKKEAMKPIIEVETKNGAILCDDDVLSVLFPIGVTQCEELRAKVVKWNVPPLKERYLDACQYFNMDPLNEISTILDATTVNLDLSNKKYRDKCLPIARALNRQTSLYELNLSGLLAGNKMLEVLCESLSSLTNLTVLNLSTNNINSEGLYILSNSLQYTQLKSLTSLNLGFNPLGNSSLKHLSAIFDCLSVETLNLCAVDFTAGLFNSNYNNNVHLNLKCLKHFDVSHNELDKTDLGKFLKFLDGKILESLNIGNNRVESNGLGRDLLKMCQDGFRCEDEQHKNALKYLDLASCMLNDDDVGDINSVLKFGELDYVDLSFNDFTGFALKDLLISKPPKRLLVMGCEQLCCLNTDVFDSRWKFGSEGCKYLETSLDYVEDFKQCDTLINLFRELHNDRLDVHGLDDGMLKLSVHSE